MMVRQYGAQVRSVDPDFDAHVLNEIAFRRNGEWSLPSAEFFDRYEKVESHALTAAADGDVQNIVKQNLLHSLREQLVAVSESVGADGVLLIESGQDDYPKTRQKQTTQLVEGAHRLFFRFTVEPPLRVAVYRKR
jgi:hypothetical protein